MNATESLRALVNGPCGTARHGCPVHVDGYDCLDALREAARAALAAAAPRVVEVEGCRDCPYSDDERGTCRAPGRCHNYDITDAEQNLWARAPNHCPLRHSPLLVRLRKP